MSAIIIPRRHLAQPQGRVAINRSGPFSAGLKIAYLPGRAADIAADSLGVARGAGVANKPAPHGLATETVSNGGLRLPLRIDSLDSVVSIFVLADRGPADADTRGSALVEIGGAGSGARILLEESGSFGSAKSLYRVNSGSAVAVESGANGPSNNPTGYGLFVTPSRISAYCGNKAGSTSHALGGAYSALHASVLGEEIAWAGRVFAAYVWVGFELTSELFSHLQHAPWQIFSADPLRIYSLPSGAITLNSLTMSAITQTTARATLGLTR